MEILEFNLPAWIMPESPYFIKENNLVIYSSNFELPKSEFVSPTNAMNVVFYNEKIDITSVKNVLEDLIFFMNFLNQNGSLFEWKMTHSLSQIEKKVKETDNIKAFVEKTMKKSVHVGNMIANFNNFPLGEITSKPLVIDFNEYFQKYLKLSNNSSEQKKIKKLIEFFAFNYSSVFTRVYNNSNFQISNAFIIIESLINIEIVNQSGYKTCENCGHKVKQKKKMTDLIEEFIDNTELPEEHKLLINEILKKHYSIRNRFFHDAKFETWNNRLSKMMQSLGKKKFTLEDEIKHAEAGFTGLWTINNLIRLKLLNLLDES